MTIDHSKKKQYKTLCLQSVTRLFDEFDNDSLRQEKDYKNLSDWIQRYCYHILQEKKFDSSRNCSYKRGQVINVEFGFGLGNEFGGIHYAIVIENTPKLRGKGCLTIIPLCSMKDRWNKNSMPKDMVFLGCEISDKIREKNRIKPFKHGIPSLNEESVALVGQITTISKMRIRNPKTYTYDLYDVIVSNNVLDLLDKKIIELYTK